MVEVKVKVCKKCSQEKAYTHFHKDKNAYLGLHPYCKGCRRILHKQHYSLHREELRQKKKQYYVDTAEIQKKKRRGRYRLNPEPAKAQSKIWQENNKERVAENSKKYAQNNAQIIYEKNRDWRAKNRGKCNAYAAKYRATKMQATPRWADLVAIQDFYSRCPAGYHVDHIIPLQGENVCGLHVLENLQYLPAAENFKKSNKFPI